ncbi:MAG: hypothetical protein HY885_00580 [Deltaproteobacteria bacterium]|nr:hypothetical protein [Deltaproteobacteria bacterium]
MKIDITHEPPADIFQDRGKYLRISAALLSLVFCGMLLIVYVLFADAASSKNLETAGLALFIGPALIFVYFCEKLQDYKKLNPDQKKELAALGQKHPEIATYCGLVAKANREPVFAEYEASKEWAEDSGYKR